MKKLTTSILLAIFSATVFTPASAEASWLSKSEKKLEAVRDKTEQRNTFLEVQSSRNDVDSESSSGIINLPKRSEYPSNFSLHRVVGNPLDAMEYQVLGVPMGATLGQVRSSLGNPTSPGHGLVYGGVRFTQVFTEGDNKDSYVVNYIEIKNRDAVTYRGIGVGDTLEKVYKMYGRPTYIFKTNTWFYGAFMWNSDFISGISFENDGERVTKIKIDAH